MYTLSLELCGPFSNISVQKYWKKKYNINIINNISVQKYWKKKYNNLVSIFAILEIL